MAKQTWWEPKFPTFADDQNDQFVKELDRTGTRHKWSSEPAESGFENDAVPWDPAPATSHVLEFRLIDARNFNPVTQLTELQGQSYIDVRFKPSEKRGVTQYQYRFSDHDYANRVYEQLLDADHPGEVVHNVLIAEQVPYAKIAEW